MLAPLECGSIPSDQVVAIELSAIRDKAVNADKGISD